MEYEFAGSSSAWFSAFLVNNFTTYQIIYFFRQISRQVLLGTIKRVFGSMILVKWLLIDFKWTWFEPFGFTVHIVQFKFSIFDTNRKQIRINLKMISDNKKVQPEMTHMMT